MLAFEVLQLPVRTKEQHAALTTIGGEDRLSAERWNRLRRIRRPSRDSVLCGIDLNLHPVLSAEAADDDVELQRADDADDRFAAPDRHVEHLHQPFFLELLEPLVELLVARVLQAHAPEVLRGEARQIEEAYRRAGMQRVADADLSRVHETDDVPGTRDADRLAVAAEEPVCARRPDRFADAAVGHRHVFGEPAGADADERDAIAMARIHVRLDLEHEPGEALVGRAYEAGVARPRLRRGREIDERLPKRPQPRIFQPGAE